MNIAYNIQPQQVDSQSRLFIELSLQGVCFTILDNNNTFTSLVSYTFPLNTNGNAAAKFLKEIFAAEKIIQYNFKRIDIIHAFAETVLVPNEFMNSDTTNEMLELIYGNINTRIVKNDLLYKHHIYNVYGVPADVAAVISEQFLFVLHSHQYSFLPDFLNAKTNSLYCIFGNNHITITLMKEGKLQLIQCFYFQTAEDVIYHLLNVCQAHRMNTKEVDLHIAGLLDIKSALYLKINHEFKNITLETHPLNFQFASEIEKIPAHFFSHLFAIAACV
ncbi:MAG: DUF3822 family protein [Ferruginibacter sp.]